MTNAFLKFVWAHRLFGYCSVLMAAVPNDPNDPAALPRASQAAEISITAARGFNKGLRSVYFGLASAAWLLGPIPLMVATVLTLLVLWRREFASQSRSILLAEQPARRREFIVRQNLLEPPHETRLLCRFPVAATPPWRIHRRFRPSRHADRRRLAIRCDSETSGYRLGSLYRRMARSGYGRGRTGDARIGSSACR